MSLLEVARDTLKEIPMSDIVRERLSLALDRLSEAETKIETLQAEKGSVTVALERERLDHQKTCEELQRLKDEYSEDIQVHSGIEFRRGKRTANTWMAFCPQCHIPADTSTVYVRCGHPKCGWNTYIGSVKQLPAIIASL